jgi:Galactose mutarotase and related enzymes
VAEARSKESGIQLQIFSTEPAVQFYTGQGLNIKNAKVEINIAILGILFGNTQAS